MSDYLVAVAGKPIKVASDHEFDPWEEFQNEETGQIYKARKNAKTHFYAESPLLPKQFLCGEYAEHICQYGGNDIDPEDLIQPEVSCKKCLRLEKKYAEEDERERKYESGEENE